MRGAVKVLMFQAESEPHSAIQASIFEDSNYFKNHVLKAGVSLKTIVLRINSIVKSYMSFDF